MPKDELNSFVEETDDAWGEAVSEAHELGLDQFVETHTAVRWEWVNEELAKIGAPHVVCAAKSVWPLTESELATVLAALRHWQEITRRPLNPRQIDAAMEERIPVR